MATTQDPITALRQDEQARQDRDTQAALAAADPNRPPSANSFPDNSNDKWLSESIAEMKKTDLEYQRLATIDARDQWEKMARAELIRQKDHERLAAETRDAALASRDVHDEKNLQVLASQSLALMRELSKYPNEHQVPLELHRQWADTESQIEHAAARMGLNRDEMLSRLVEISSGLLGLPAPSPISQQPPIPEQPITEDQLKNYGNVEQLPDGSFQVKLATGEVFKGDAVTVMDELAKSKVHAVRWAQPTAGECATATAHKWQRQWRRNQLK